MSEENWGYQLLHLALRTQPHFYSKVKELRLMKSLCWEGRLSTAGTREKRIPAHLQGIMCLQLYFLQGSIYLLPKRPVLHSPRRTDSTVNFLMWAKAAMLVFGRTHFLKNALCLQYQLSQGGGQKWSQKAFFERGMCLFFSPYIRSKFTIYYSLICGMRVWQACSTPVNVGSFPEGLCSWDALPQQNHQGEQRAHLTSSDCKEKGRAISAALHQVQLVAWAMGVLPSQVQGEEATLLLKLVPTHGFSPFLPSDGGKQPHLAR